MMLQQYYIVVIHYLFIKKEALNVLTTTSLNMYTKKG